MSVTYPHCKHCCWNSEHHPETHTTPCWSGCATGTRPEPEKTHRQGGGPDLLGWDGWQGQVRDDQVEAGGVTQGAVVTALPAPGPAPDRPGRWICHQCPWPRWTRGTYQQWLDHAQQHEQEAARGLAENG